MALPNNVPRTIKLLDGATATGAGNRSTAYKKSFIQAILAGTGAITATILIEVSSDGIQWDVMATLTLSGTTTASSSFNVDTEAPFIRANMSAVSGTGAVATVNMCI